MFSGKRSLVLARNAAVALALVFGVAALEACGEDEGGELEVWDIEPRVGATAGQQTVKIRGVNFRRDIGYTVYFGRNGSTRTTILDDNTMLVSTPQNQAGGLVDVVVVADDGPAFRIANGFNYEDMGGNVVEQLGGDGTGSGGQERF